MTDWPTIDAALQAFVAGATGITTIFADQDGPEPATPYCTIKRGDLLKPYAAADEVSPVTNLANGAGLEVEHTVLKVREFVVRLRAFSDLGPGGAQLPATDYLAAAQDAALLPSSVAAFDAAGVCTVDEGESVRDLSSVVETRWQSSAGLDFRFRLADKVVEKAGYVDGVIFNTPPGTYTT